MGPGRQSANRTVTMTNLSEMMREEGGRQDMGTEVDGPASASAPRPPPDKRSSRVTAGDVCYWAFSGTRMTTSEVCREAGPCAVQGAGSRLGLVSRLRHGPGV